ncbi:hypothetical protein ACIO1C_14445 [Streptomyces sp. NPDC087420]|uniref:hypothetical protein n=1 Tax=Streptomyces sp. NPDC087420 TaxID=3365785 RepID=UPI0038339657
MQIQRALQYARCAAVLDSDPDVPSEGTYDQALTNGLAAIVAHEWPGEEANAKGRMHAANTLLDVIEQHAVAQPDGSRLIPWVRFDGSPAGTRVDVAALRHGVTETQGVRHARGTGTLERAHVDALVALDDHPALRRIGEVTSDGQWVNAKIADSYEQQRAEEYLIFIGDEEADERAERAPDRLEPYHPRHNPDRNGTELGYCPVCHREAFKLDTPDEEYGMSIGACLVCSYTRSPQVSYYLTLTAEMEATFPTD